MKRFKLFVYLAAAAIASAVVLSSCGIVESNDNRVITAALAKNNAINDSLNALPISVYCGMVQGFKGDSCLFAATVYERDSMALDIELATEQENLRRYAVDVDSIATNTWTIIVK